MAQIELVGIEKRWGDVAALRDIDLAIDDGEFVAVLGPSGCGKSTMLLILAGIYAPTHGSVRFDGVPVDQVEARDRNVGIVFQAYALYPHMSVRDNIRFPLRFKSVGADEARARAERAAALVQVEDLLERRPAQLSGGQQQRVALARALVKEPQLLLLDEPLSNLDAGLRMTMRTEIRAIQRELGVTTVLVTHDQLEAITMADRIVCMRDGAIEQVGTGEDLYARPATLFVAGFIGSPPANLVAGEVAAGAFTAGAARLRCEGAPAGGAMLAVRPEHLRLGDEGLPATVCSVEPMGRETAARAGDGHRAGLPDRRAVKGVIRIRNGDVVRYCDGKTFGGRTSEPGLMCRRRRSGNSTSRPSPVVLTIRPWPRAMMGGVDHLAGNLREGIA